MDETIFTVDSGNKQMIAEREFKAPLPVVWRAWTEAALLEKWWAPMPWKAVSKHMDFREGGHWLYCMQGPDGEQHWGKSSFRKIVKNEFYDADDVFCDEEGTENKELPAADWHVSFSETDSGTRVKVTTTFESEEDMTQLIDMGVQEGTKMCHRNLDEVLEEILALSQS